MFKDVKSNSHNKLLLKFLNMSIDLKLNKKPPAAAVREIQHWTKL